MSTERDDIHSTGVPVICQSCNARHNGICGVLSDGELIELGKHSRQVTHKAGDLLIGDAQSVQSYATVLEGVVKLSKILEDGRQQVVGLQFAPDFLGRLYGRQSTINADAASDVIVCRIPRNTLEKLVSSNSALEAKLLDQTLRELDEARDWMVTLGQKTANEKVASFIHLIAQHISVKDGHVTSFDLPLSRSDIADFLGLTIETVSRQFTKLRTSGVIEIEHHRHVTIPDIDRLRLKCG